MHSSIVTDVFGDVNEDNQSYYLLSDNNDDENVFHDEFLDEWNEILQDDEMFDMILDNYFVIVPVAEFSV